MTNPTDDLAVVIPTAPFDEFEGDRVTDAILTFKGSVVLRGPIGRHGRAIIVLDVEVTNVEHLGNGEGTLKRVEKSNPATGYILPGKLGRRMLSAARHADRIAADSGDGRTAIEGILAEEVKADGLELTTDGSGVVLTPDELAAAGLDDSSLDPRVIIVVPWEKIDGRKPGVGQKLIYPDETQALTAGDGCPQPGDRLQFTDGIEPGGAPTKGEVVVVEVLDPVTGETLGEWTWELEKARMLEQEQAAEEAEGLTDGQLVNRQPWDGYDGEKVGEIVDYLDNLGTTELGHVVAYEEAHRGRKGVVKAARERLAELAQIEAQQDDLADLDLPPLDGEEG